MSVEIRGAAPGDRHEVLGLLEAQLGEHSVQPPRAALEYAVDRILEAPERGRIFVATSAGTVVGVAAVLVSWSIEHGGASSWLDELYVRPSHRGRGIGTSLLSAAREFATAEGCAALELEVE